MASMDFLQMSAMLLLFYFFWFCFLKVFWSGEGGVCCSLPFLSVSSISLACSPVSYMCTFMAEDLQASKQLHDDSTWRGPVTWASEPHMSLVSTCVGYSSILLSCFSWSIYHKLCKLSQRGDRRLVQVFFWNRQGSQEAHWCSGHVDWSTATLCQPSPPLHRPATLWGALSFICLQIAFPPCSHSWKAEVLKRFQWLLWRTSPVLVWLKDFAESPSANANAYYHILLT